MHIIRGEPESTGPRVVHLIGRSYLGRQEMTTCRHGFTPTAFRACRTDQLKLPRKKRTRDATMTRHMRTDPDLTPPPPAEPVESEGTPAE